jgi:sec-independent protein translocase protein TatA
MSLLLWCGSKGVLIMGGFSTMHWVIVALVVLVLFGRGKISETMGDFGKGIKSFRKGMAEEMDRPAPQIPAQNVAPQADSAPVSAPVSAPATSDTATKL